MGQLTVYIDDSTLKKVETAAHREHKSISKWVKKCLESALQNKWPENYFEVFGALSGDESFQRPPQGDVSEDTRRNRL